MAGSYNFVRDFVTEKDDETTDRTLCIELPDGYLDLQAPVKGPVHYFGIRGPRLHFGKASAKFGGLARQQRRPLNVSSRPLNEAELAAIAAAMPHKGESQEAESEGSVSGSVTGSSESSSEVSSDSELSSLDGDGDVFTESESVEDE